MRFLKIIVAAILWATAVVEGLSIGFDLVNTANDGAVVLGACVIGTAIVVPSYLFTLAAKKGWL